MTTETYWVQCPACGYRALKEAAPYTLYCPYGCIISDVHDEVRRQTGDMRQWVDENGTVALYNEDGAVIATAELVRETES